MEDLMVFAQENIQLAAYLLSDTLEQNQPERKFREKMFATLNSRVENYLKSLVTVHKKLKEEMESYE